MAIRFRDKLPRKAKKAILGKKITKKELRAKLKKISISNKSIYIMMADNEIDRLFCPVCGCKESYSINHDVGYPEVWTEDFCSRCDNKVGGADNSNWEHVLEYEELVFN